MLLEKVIGSITLLVYGICYHGLFAYDHINFAHYAPVCWLQMMSLHETDLEADGMLKAGHLGVQRNKHTGFGQVAIDQTI